MLFISKQQTYQRFIYKIHSSRLRKAKWDLMLPISEARKNDEVISLSSSQLLRFIDELNGVVDADEKVKAIKKELRYVKKLENSIQNRRKIKELYTQLDEIQFKPDYLCLIIDKEKDYWRACKGFSINNIKYVRLLGTNGGVKTSTIVFVSERLAPELKRRIDNGRDKTKPIVPAKLEAYQALTCSGSTPVSFPKGIAVVDDCITHFKSDVIHLRNTEHGEPVMEFEKDAEVELNESDGYGLILPSLAKRWSDELKLGYTAGGMNTRCSWEKGMVFAFDFLEFADKVAGTRIIKDAWGNKVDLTNVELILTTSMLKLWDSYKDCDSYIKNCLENHYTFSITKTCPKELEKRRDLNYQFIQSYNLSDDQIEELVKPTIDEIHDILGADWKRSVLYLKGIGLTEDTIKYMTPDCFSAIMIEPEMINDPFVRKKIHSLIKKRITDAKIGVIRVHGNYSIISGDPYSLCQNIFGLEVTGLLEAGQIYNSYWANTKSQYLACFRAPMTCHNNIRKVEVNRSEDALYWYRYMNSCTILNSWDTSAHALNGADKDGDLVMLTDNSVLVSQLRELPAILCAQNKVDKSIPTEEVMIRTNINSFGDEIGKITNRITTMFDVMAQYSPDSKEYRVLDYRIKCGQLFQQDAIDKAKGVISKPMPKYWYDRGTAYGLDSENNDEGNFNTNIAANKKPYFMRYIYPTMMRQYNTYIGNTNKKCLREFRLTIDELLNKPDHTLSEDERSYIKYYYRNMPVGINNCVMNRICKRIEEEFDGYVSKKITDCNFDFNIMKSGQEYSAWQYRCLYNLYMEYTQRISEYAQLSSHSRVDEFDMVQQKKVLQEDFKKRSLAICSNASQLCDILIDICYKKEGTKQFVWDIVGDEIIHNLLLNKQNIINYPVKSDDGDIEYLGEKFIYEQCKLEGLSERNT